MVLQIKEIKYCPSSISCTAVARTITFTSKVWYEQSNVGETSIQYFLGYELCGNQVQVKQHQFSKQEGMCRFFFFLHM